MKFKKYSYNIVKSTNDVSLRKIKLKKKQGIIISNTQTSGRGRYGKHWISIKGNLFMSIFFRTKNNISLKTVTKLNCEIIKNSIYQVIKKNIKIKYPNDLLINNRKFCGILQETVVCKNERFIIIGIGINLIKSPNIQNYLTTNILKETGLSLNKIKISKLIELNYYKKLNLFA